MSLVFIFSSFAAVFWFVMFSPWTSGRIGFWFMMPAATAFLVLAAVAADRKKLREVFKFETKFIFIGLVSAVFLYMVFFVGKFVAGFILPFANSQIESIYSVKSQSDAVRIGLLLFFWIGPAEEIFWRGFIQRRLSEKFNPEVGYVLALAVYTAIHIWSFNFMLVTASLVCGVVWGFLYYRYKSIWPGLISHAVWDVLIFVLFPVV